MEPYGKKRAETIIGNLYDGMLEVKKDGIWPSKESILRLGYSAELESSLDWTFWWELDEPDTPDPLEVPNLPIPFAANQLAAFMLDGIGGLVREQAYGEWQKGPNEESLTALGGGARKPKEALRAAYAAYREAEKIVGKLDKTMIVLANELRKEFNQNNDDANILALAAGKVPRCPACQALLRPSVVWFSEQLDPQILVDAMTAVSECDVLICVGCSMLVEPAASMPYVALEQGACLIEVNTEPTLLSKFADANIIGRAGEGLPELVR